MIIVLHGDNQVASREKFIVLREDAIKKGFNVVNLDGKATDTSKIDLYSQTTTLLGQGTAVFIEDFFTNKKVKNKEQSFTPGGEVVFWEPREVTKSELAKFPESWKVEYFPIPKLIFKFLDSINFKNQKETIAMLHEVLQKETPELIIPLFSWHIRQLIWAKQDPKSLAVPSWKVQRLLAQASQVTLEELYHFHEKLLKLDRSIKTSTNPLPLISSLDLILTTT